MAKKETLAQFIGNLHNMDGNIQKLVMAEYNDKTLLALSVSKDYAPFHKGNLRRSGHRIKAKITTGGIRSAYVFGVPYAYKLEIDESLNIVNTQEQAARRAKKGEAVRYNEKAQTGYGSKGIDHVEKPLMNAIKSIVSKVWNKI